MILIYYVAELLYISKCTVCIVPLPFSLGVCDWALFFVKLFGTLCTVKSTMQMNRSKAYSETHTHIECVGICSFIIRTAVSKSGEEND